MMNKVQLPEIIQGGMGVGVSNWHLARAVSLACGLGVVSGTALDTVMIRRLQDGDADGSIRRALKAFPYPEMVAPILTAWFQSEGRGGRPYRLKSLPCAEMARADEILLIVANFVEVYLAKEGHDAPVGINYLEKIQLPTLPSLFGAMLAGVDVVLMGGGIPLAIPGVLDAMANLQPVELKLNLVSRSQSGLAHKLSFHPGTYVAAAQKPLKRPQFLAVIASDVLAKTMVRKASGRVDGFVVEHYCAGGHNAPPRTQGAYGERDACDLEQMAVLGCPFWLAGGKATSDALRMAHSVGARGIQVGTAFALCRESGIQSSIKLELVKRYLKKELEVVTDFEASPTGYPFKRIDLPGVTKVEARQVCDLGYLRHVYEKEDGSIGYRCPASIKKYYFRRGGSPDGVEGKRCLCNGLLSTVGLGQTREGNVFAPLITCGDDLTFLREICEQYGKHYSAQDVVNYLKSVSNIQAQLTNERQLHSLR